MMDISPEFSVAALALSAPVVGYMLVESLWGKWSHERMLRRRDHDPKALTGMYRSWIAGSWAVTALVLLVVAVAPGVASSDLGLTLPGEMSTTLGMAAGAGVGLVLMAVLRHRGVRFGRGAPEVASLTAMRPRNAAERLHGLAMAVTAGICEEIVYRGFLIALGVGVLGLGTKPAAYLALALFVMGHLYQGWRGMLLVAVAGNGLTMLYLKTGSLLLPILLHILIDVVALAATPKPAERQEKGALAGAHG